MSRVQGFRAHVGHIALGTLVLVGNGRIWENTRNIKRTCFWNADGISQGSGSTCLGVGEQ